MDLIIAVILCVMILVINAVLLVASLLILRANQKMYTEYFKDRSILARSKENPK